MPPALLDRGSGKPGGVVTPCPICLLFKCEHDHAECSPYTRDNPGRPRGRPAAARGRDGAIVLCQECGARLLEAAELCGFCIAEHSEAA